jgi:hypothetical protein
MMLLVNGATKTVYSTKDHREHLGVLFSPGCGNSIDKAIASGLSWACDNGAFSGFDESAYRRLLDECLPHTRHGLLWVTCPDVVGNHQQTLDLFDHWGMFLHRRGLPIAFVAQDGCKCNEIPWEFIRCVFIGGTTEWKLSPQAQEIIFIARLKAMWVHVGRVNTRRRIRWCFDQDVNSIDGTSMSRFSETYLPKFLAYTAGLTHQERLPIDAPRAYCWPQSTKVEHKIPPTGAIVY